MIKAGILGGSGYMGGEALRVLLEHPDVEIAWVTARSGGDIADYHPNLYGRHINLIHPDAATPCDVVFLALPTAESIKYARIWLEKGSKVIDLGAAFRLKDRQTWEKVYQQQHTDWELVSEAAYGINECHLEEIRKARLIANPGCFASAAILGLAPLVKMNLIDTERITVSGLSGTTGAGVELSRLTHHPEIANNLIPYNVINHRHTFEMEQELSAIAGKAVCVNFTPVYVPITRGILNICDTHFLKSISREEVLSVFRDYYKNAPFVRVYDLPREDNVSYQYKPYPWVSSIAGTNYCFIGCDVDQARQRIVVFSVLDSIGKGGAQVGIENMNIMFNLDRKTGLARPGLHPG
jgi:N-acetyl-gamma-glutamyl-phosphate reductase common form